MQRARESRLSETTFDNQSMLRIIQNRAPQSAKSYYQAGDYYAEGKEVAGLWGGKGAKLLGLAGPLQQRDFEALCDNLHPLTGEQLTSRMKADRTVGYDFNFHAPKSVSVVHALTGDERIAEAFRAAVSETMQEIETEAKVRVRKGKENSDRIVGNLTWAEFVHLTSRPIDGVPDPHLHAHCFVFNAVYDQIENDWKAGQFRDLKRDGAYFEAAFQNRFAAKLGELGYRTERSGRAFELSGISRSVIDRFSRRTQEIEGIAAAKGIQDPEEKAKLGAKTRQGKSKELSPSQLLDEWRSRLSDDENKLIRALPLSTTPIAKTVDATLLSMKHAKDHCFERASVVPAKRLLEQALRFAVGNMEVDDLKKMIVSSDILYGERDGQTLTTTREVLKEEQQLLHFARSTRGTLPALNAKWSFQREWLNVGQKSAIQQLLHSGDRVQILKGRAGTGKTTLMTEAIEAMQANGSKVFTFAPSAEASRGVLRSKGFENADTVARLLVDSKLQNQVAGDVLWIDEAGLLGTKTLKQVFDLAEQRDCRVILSGDWSQHGSVERGAAMRLLAQSAGIKVAEVNQIQRQQDQYKSIVEAISQGKLALGFSGLQDLQWITEVEPEQLPAQVAKAYVDSLDHYKSTLVVSPTHFEGNLTTAAIREELRRRKRIKSRGQIIKRLEPRNLTEAERRDRNSYREGDIIMFQQNATGHVKGERITVEGLPSMGLLQHADKFQVFESVEMELSQGDLIRITGNGTTLDQKHRLNNGTTYRLKDFTPRGDLILENNWVVSQDYGRLVHGYVVTSHASQGKSVDHIILAQSSLSRGAASQEQWYVSVSRGEKYCTILTDDAAALQESISRHEERLTATEFVQQKRSEKTRELARRHAIVRDYANASASLLKATHVERDYVR